jgi:membrane-associated HD superfamily phosphohydrolase
MKTKMIIEKKEVIKSERSYSSVLANITGVSVSAALIGYFLIMRAFNLHEVLWLRYLNFVILLIGLVIAFITYKKKNKAQGIDYLTGLKIGFQITSISTTLFAIFIGIYLSIDHHFMEYLKSHAFYGSFLTPGLSAIGILMEGHASGAIMTFMAMQYFKANNDTET